MSENKPFTISPYTNGQPRLCKECSYPQGFALTTACRRIRQECTQLFYANNDFIFCLRPEASDGLDKFLSMIGETNARALRSVTLKTAVMRRRDIDQNSNSKPNARPSFKLWEPMETLRRQANCFAWSAAKMLITFKMNLLNHESEIGFDMLDLERPWDVIEEELTTSISKTSVRSHRHFLMRLRNETSRCREKLREG